MRPLKKKLGILIAVFGFLFYTVFEKTLSNIIDLSIMWYTVSVIIIFLGLVLFAKNK